MTANTSDDTSVQAATARQEATIAIREAKAAQARAHERERTELAQELAELQKAMEADRGDVSDAMQEAISNAIRRANNRDDLMVLYAADVARLIGKNTLAKLRQETAPGSLPTMIMATAPVAGEKQPRGPVLAIVDLTEKLGWQE